MVCLLPEVADAQLFCEHGDGEQIGEGVQAVAHDGFQKGFGLHVVAFQDVPEKDRR